MYNFNSLKQRIKIVLDKYFYETLILDYILFILIFLLPSYVSSREFISVVTLATIPIIISSVSLYIQFKIRKEVAEVSLKTYLTENGDRVVAYTDDYLYYTIKTFGVHTISETWGHLKEVRIVGGDLGRVTVLDDMVEIVPTVIPNKGQVLKKDCRFANLKIVTEKDTLITVSYRLGL